MAGEVGNARQYWRTDIGPTLTQQLSIKSWSTIVGPTLALHWVIKLSTAQHMLADCKSVIFFNIMVILIMKIIDNLFLYEILCEFALQEWYLHIFGEFVIYLYTEQGKIINALLSCYECFYKILDYT